MHPLSSATAPQLGRAFGRALFVGLTLLAATPLGAQAAEPKAATRTLADLTGDQRAMLMIELANTGRHAQAAGILKSHPLSGPHAKNRTLFIEGLILRAYGDLEGATAKFRSALASDPSLTMVRAELATTLNAMGETDSAKHHLKQLMTEAPDAQAASQIKSFIDSIDESRPTRFTSFISLAPSTNVNNGTHHDKIYSNNGAFVPDNRQKSGAGLSAGFNVGHTQWLNEHYSAIAGLGLNGSVYEETDYNNFTASEVIELRRQFEWGHIGLGPTASQTITDGGFNFSAKKLSDPDFASFTYGARLNLLYRLSPRASLQSVTMFDVREYIEAPGYNAEAYGEQFTLSYGFNQSLVGHIVAGYDHSDAKVKLLGTDAFVGGLGLYKELPWGLTATADARVRYTKYLGDWAVAGAPREDLRYDASLGITKRDWNIFGYAPEVEYSFTTNNSNVQIYDFNSHTVDFRLTKEF